MDEISEECFLHLADSLPQRIKAKRGPILAKCLQGICSDFQQKKKTGVVNYLADLHQQKKIYFPITATDRAISSLIATTGIKDNEIMLKFVTACQRHFLFLFSNYYYLCDESLVKSYICSYTLILSKRVGIGF